MGAAETSVRAFANAIADGEVQLTNELREEIAHLNAVCARVHFGKDPRPQQTENPKEYA